MFYTDDEYKEAFGKIINIQKAVEEPEIHFIAKCGSSDNEQLLYSEEMLKCICELNTNCNDKVRNIQFTD